MTKKKAYVIGTNVSSSLSPAIFEYWFKKYNVNAKYNHKEMKKILWVSISQCPKKKKLKII